MKKLISLVFFISVFIYFQIYSIAGVDSNCRLFIDFSLCLAILISFRQFIDTTKISSIHLNLIVSFILVSIGSQYQFSETYLEFFFQASIGLIAFIIGSELSLITLFKRIKIAVTNYLVKLSILLVFIFALLNSLSISSLQNADILTAILIGVLILLPEPVFIKAFFEDRSGHVYLEKLYINRHILQFFFSLVLLFLISPALGNGSFNEIYFRSIGIGVLLNVLLRLVQRYILSENVMLFFVSFFAIAAFDYNIQSIDFFIVYFVCGLLFSRNHQVATFTGQLKSVQYPAIFVIILIFASQINFSIDYVLLGCVFVLIKFGVIYISNYLEIRLLFPGDEKYPFLKFSGSLQGITALLVLIALRESFVIDAGLMSLFSTYLVLNSIIGIFMLDYGINSYDQQFQKTDESKDEIDSENIEIDNFPDFLNNSPNIKRYINFLMTSYQELQTDFLDNVHRLLFEHYHDLLKDIRENYTNSLKRLLKEIELIAKQEDEVIKERIRDNRGKFAFGFQSLLNDYRKTVKKEEEVFNSSKSLFMKVELLFKQFPVLMEQQTDYNMYPQTGENFLFVGLKSLKRSFFSFVRFFNKSFQFYHKIYLVEILTFHLYKRYSSVIRVLVNTMFQQHYDMLRKIHNIYKEIDKQFQEMFIYLENREKINFADLKKHIEKNKQETEKDIDLLNTDFEIYYETNHGFLSKGFNHWINAAYSDMAISGTFQYSRRKRRLSQTYPVYQSEQEKTQELIENWNSLVQSYFGHFSIDMDIRHVQNKTRKIVNHAIQSFEDYLEKDIDLNMAETKFLIADYTTKIQNADHHIIHNTIDGIKKKIVYQVKINLEKSIEHLKNSKAINVSFNEVIETIHDVINELPNAYKLSLSNSHSIKMGETPDEIILVRVPFRSICRTFMELEITQTIADVNSQVSVGLDNLLQILNESVDGFSTEIESVLDLSDFNELKSEMIRILNSVRLKVNEADEFLQSLKKSIDESIVREIVLSIQKVKQLTIDEIDKLIHSEIQKKRGENELLVIPFIKNRIESIRQNMLPYIGKLRHKLRSFKESEAEKLVTLENADTILLNDQTFSHIPFMYRKLLSLEPVEIFEFLSNRNSQIELIREAFSRWKKGLSSNVAIFGEMGSGKTSLVNCVIKYIFKDERIYRFKLQLLAITEENLVLEISRVLNIKEPINSFESLKHKIKQEKITGIFIFESVQRILVKHFNGFELIQKFQSFVSAVSDQILWINTYAHQAWIYLENVINVDDFYAYKIHLRNLNKAELRQLIETRNSLSGYKFKFEGSKPNGNNRLNLFKSKVESE
ncbi:MAG: ATP-binding protein, partial [Calditrichaeota bacterium]|nr:ATP-binding protein [Calditrichota bacterium]